MFLVRTPTNDDEVVGRRIKWSSSGLQGH